MYSLKVFSRKRTVIVRNSTADRQTLLRQAWPLYVRLSIVEIFRFLQAIARSFENYNIYQDLA